MKIPLSTAALAAVACYAPPKLVPVTYAVVSTVLCSDVHGVEVYRHESRDKVHTLTRAPCYWWLMCCLSDPPKLGEDDGRGWAVGFEGEDSAVVIDGRGVECSIVKGRLP